MVTFSLIFLASGTALRARWTITQFYTVQIEKNVICVYYNILKILIEVLCSH
ncbi:hypothetical protein SAMN04488082_10412 [Desulfomicrobium apsheronum]|uniref:Uncharacterized protein n=1 Tax=Desulfomicrobium apsheronum TaxID=52560 RepID=A0A1I3S6Q0_9BACT|nr:hypothetical protein SAMN04488082_10412 [Desulfomicrobium apsheronum]